jgi:hypothetical protein
MLDFGRRLTKLTGSRFPLHFVHCFLHIVMDVMELDADVVALCATSVAFVSPRGCILLVRLHNVIIDVRMKK